MNRRLMVMAPEGEQGGGSGAGQQGGEGAGAGTGFFNGQGAGGNGQSGAGKSDTGNSGGSGQGANVNPYPTTDWRHSLPEDIRAEESLKIMNDIPTLAKSYVHAQKTIGADKIALPGKHATDADWEQVYDRLGRPKLEEYKANIPKDAKYITDEDAKALIPIAHKVGVLPKQLDAILDHYEKHTAGLQKARADKINADISETVKGLKSEWGQAFDQKAAWAKRFVTEHGGPEMIKFLASNPEFDFNPNFIRMAAKLGEQFYKEDGIKSGQPSGGIATPGEAQHKVNAILADYKHPYYDSAHPNHKAALQEVADLYALIHPKAKEA